MQGSDRLSREIACNYRDKSALKRQIFSKNFLLVTIKSSQALDTYATISKNKVIEVTSCSLLRL